MRYVTHCFHFWELPESSASLNDKKQKSDHFDLVLAKAEDLTFLSYHIIAVRKGTVK
jgi:hypothetical protein